MQGQLPSGGLSTRLEELILANGRVHDHERLGDRQAGDVSVEEEKEERSTFGADLVLCQENGFELWLGSLEDALCLSALRERGINALLNCALEECERECAVFRSAGLGRRRRCHARGESIGKTVDGCEVLDNDQVRAVALFEGEWYSSVLGHETSYLGVAADDEAGYPMERHFAEVAAFLSQCRDEGRKVLVHCVMGINRSSAALVAFLCSSMAMTLLESVDLISRQRGYILSNASFLRQLVDSYGQESGEEKGVEHEFGRASHVLHDG